MEKKFEIPEKLRKIKNGKLKINQISPEKEKKIKRVENFRKRKMKKSKSRNFDSNSIKFYLFPFIRRFRFDWSCHAEQHRSR